MQRERGTEREINERMNKKAITTMEKHKPLKRKSQKKEIQKKKNNNVIEIPRIFCLVLLLYRSVYKSLPLRLC